MTRTLVHLLRHGEVDNPTGVLYGRLAGFRLSPAGERMAALAAEALAGRDVVLLRSSPLERARQTAEPLAAAFGLDVAVDARLVESLNVFEGQRVSVGDGVLREPVTWRYLWNPFRPSWGEAYAAVAQRMLAAAADAATAAAGHEAVLVSHQLPITVARRAVAGQRLWHRPDRRMCALASITTFSYVDGRVEAVGYREPVPAPTPSSRPARGG